MHVPLTPTPNELIALDLGTGQEVWRTGMVDGRATHLVPITDGSIATPLLPINAQAHEDEELTDHVRSGIFGADNQQAVWTGQQLVIFRTLYYTSKRRSGGDGGVRASLTSRPRHTRACTNCRPA